MSNPFENEEGGFLVLVNDEAQFSLWPAPIGVPGGWATVLESDSRQECLEYIDKHWRDVRPKSLAMAVDEVESRE
nr:MbtH family NRPS accessory protein [Streptomyces lucensis]